MARVNKNFESLTDEAIDNIREDRAQAQDLLRDLVKYIGRDGAVHCGVVIQLDERPLSTALVLLQSASHSIWIQRRNLEIIQ